MSQRIKGVKLYLFLALALWAPGLVRAQTSVQITSPADGSPVNPGQTLIVSVSVSGAAPAQLMVVGEDPIGFSQAFTSAPYQFSIQIPSDIQPGMYTLAAWGATASGDTIESEFISIDVERPDSPSSFTVEPASLSLWIGDQTSLRLVGTYGDSSTVDLTKSTQTSYVSQSPNVATVTADGFVTALGPGSTQIVINGSIVVPVSVSPPISIAPSQATLAASRRASSLPE